MLIRDVISRIRLSLNISDQEITLTDRYIYSLLLKYVIFILESRKLKNVRAYTSYYDIKCVDLIKVEKNFDDCCIPINIFNNCNVMRSKGKLPRILHVNGIPLIKSVTSIDKSFQYHYGDLEYLQLIFSIRRNILFNKEKYFYIDNDYLYIFNDNIKAVSISAIFYDFSNVEFCDIALECNDIRDLPIVFDQSILAEAEEMVRKEISGYFMKPNDQFDLKTILGALRNE